MRSKPAYWQGAQKITDWTVEGIRTYFMTAAEAQVLDTQQK
jgi:hypothetical protein